MRGLFCTYKCAVAGLCLNAIYSALIDSEATEVLMNVDREWLKIKSLFNHPDHIDHMDL